MLNSTALEDEGGLEISDDSERERAAADSIFIYYFRQFHYFIQNVLPEFHNYF